MGQDMQRATDRPSSQARLHRWQGVTRAVAFALTAALGWTLLGAVPSFAEPAPADPVVAWVAEYSHTQGAPTTDEEVAAFVGGLREQLLALGTEAPADRETLIVAAGAIGGTPATQIADALAANGTFYDLASTPAGEALADPRLVTGVADVIGADNVELLTQTFTGNAAGVAPDGDLPLADAVSHEVLLAADGEVQPLILSEGVTDDVVLTRTVIPSLLENSAITFFGSLDRDALDDMSDPASVIAAAQADSEVFLQDVDLLLDAGGQVVGAGNRGEVVPGDGQTLLTGASLMGLPDDNEVLDSANGISDVNAETWEEMDPQQRYYARAALATTSSDDTYDVVDAVAEVIDAAVSSNLTKVCGSSCDIVSMMKDWFDLNEDLKGSQQDFLDAARLFQEGRIDEAQALITKMSNENVGHMGGAIVGAGVSPPTTLGGLVTFGAQLGFYGMGAVVGAIAHWGLEGPIGDYYRKLYAAMAELEELEETPPKDPVVIDVLGDGFTPTTVDDGAHFDLDANGFAEKINWISGDDVLLARDLDGNGRIDNGREVFGDRTLLPDGATAANGFEALNALDSNGDHALTAADDSWSELLAWNDQTNRGRTDLGELLPLSDLGVETIQLDAATVTTTTTNGVIIGNSAPVVFVDGHFGQAGLVLGTDPPVRHRRDTDPGPRPNRGAPGRAEHRAGGKHPVPAPGDRQR